MKTLGLCYFLWKKQGTLLIFGRGMLKAIRKAIQLRANSIFFFGQKMAREDGQVAPEFADAEEGDFLFLCYN